MSDANARPFRLNRSVFILAKPDTVFAFFQDSARWASWWGAGSTIDPRPGGKVYVRHPGGVEAVGEIVDINAPDRIVFTYGYASGKPMGPGESLVTIQLSREAGGTRLTLTHELENEAAHDEHIQGWRFQLSLFGNLVSNAQNANVAAHVDQWIAAWAEPDEAKRTQAFESVAAPDVRFGDRYSILAGLDEVSAHAGAAQKFMPGMRMQRDGVVRHCLGTVLVNWIVPGPEGAPIASGTNVFTVGGDGKFLAVTGLWN